MHFSKKKTIFILSFVLLFSIVGFAFKQFTDSSKLAQRQELIHERGSLVMPFDLSQTTHYFSSTVDGGYMQVKAKNPNDQKQIELIRSHLKQEQENFSKADFSDPKTLHGENMPGLAVLSQSKGKYTTEYLDLEDGTQLTFKTNDSEVMDAIHMWFMAQMTDHGSDATSM